MTTTPEQQETLLPDHGPIHIPSPAGPIPDWRIRQLAEQGMISPFEPGKIRQVEARRFPAPFIATGRASSPGAPWDTYNRPVISYGTSSYGYDLTLSPNDFRIFRHVPGLIVDPKAFDDRCLANAGLHHDERDGDYFILPGHTYSLGAVIPYLKLPPNVTAQFIGKSTYARCGIIVNLTPGEAGWEGYLTLEISNSSGADCRIYANEGICQALFYEGLPCDNAYGEGKYQKQPAGVTLAKV
jgi:dCTP deaminase